MIIAFAAISLMLAAIILFFLLIMPRRQAWGLWLSLLVVAAFGPFLDILTRLPMNWIFGSTFLALPAIIFVRALVHPKRQAERSGPTIRVQPVLGLSFLLYTLYFALQTLRPDVHFWSALMALRAPLIGFSAYLVTVYAVQSPTRAVLLGRMRQFAKLFAIIGIVVAAYGIFQYVVGFGRLQAWGLVEADGLYLHNQRNLDGGTAVFRIFSTMRRNEVLGVFLYLNIVISVAGLYFRVKPRSLILFNIAISLITLLLALSLTNLVVPLIWFCLILLVNRSKRLLQSLLVLIPISIGLMLLINWRLDGLILTRFQEHLLDTQEGIGRLAMLRNWTLELAERSVWTLLFGSGICTGSDADTLARVQSLLNAVGISLGEPFACGWNRIVQDNWYATHSLEVGVIGLLLFWLIFALVAFHSLPTLRRRWKSPERNAWTLLALGVLALFPTGFVGALLLYMPITAYLWTLMALIDVGTAKYVSQQ